MMRRHVEIRFVIKEILMVSHSPPILLGIMIKVTINYPDQYQWDIPCSSILLISFCGNLMNIAPKHIHDLLLTFPFCTALKLEQMDILLHIYLNLKEPLQYMYTFTS